MLLALVAVLSLNLFGRLMLDRFRLDVTQEKLFTITDATRRVLGGLKEPLELRFYFSRALAERAAPYAEHGARIAAMLRRYAELAPGRLQVRVIDPEPYSEEEDRAIAAGLQAVPLPDGRSAWFGIVGENATGQREVLPFLPVERAPFLEHDLTLLVYRLSLPRKPVLGVLSSLPMFGKVLPGGRRGTEWAIIAQLKPFYEVRRIDPAGKGEGFKGLDALLLATPVVAQEPLWRALKQYLLSGKPALLALDPYTEAAMSEMALIGKGTLKQDDPLVGMLRGWGIEPPVGRFVADPAFAREVVFADDTGRQRKAPWLAWLELNGNAFAKSFESFFVNVGSMNLGSAGALRLAPGHAGLKAEPVMAASPRARLLDVKLLFPPEPPKLLAAHAAASRQKRQQRPWLALRISGEVKTARKAAKAAKVRKEGKNGKDGKEEAGQKAAENGSASTGRLNLLLIGDSDFLADRFWARLQDIGGGRKLVLPLAGNATFVLNALARLTGGEVLAGLTGRKLKERRFTRVEEIRRRAEAQYRAREQQLRQQLKAAEKRLAGITARVEGGRLVISEKDQRRIHEVRQEILRLRRALRDVQQALVRDIQGLHQRLFLLNVIGVPLLITLLGLLVWWRGRAGARRQARAQAGGPAS